MSKRFVLSGYFGFKNFGDEAILSTIISRLKLYKHRITVISSDPEYTKSKYSHIRSIKTFNFRDIVGAISKSDCLISGGGSLLQDVTSLKSLIYYLLIIFIALFLKKQVLIFAQGIGPISSNFGIFLTKNLLKFANYISVRDIKSHELLTSWGIDSDLVCDPIFSTQIEHVKKENIVAVQLREFKNLNEDFIDRLAQKITYEFPNKTIHIYSFQDTIDLEICNKFKMAINLLNPDINTTVFSDLNDEEIIKGISASEYLIAMRFHALIIGLISGAKTMGINYDIKVEKLAKEFDIPLIELHNDFNKQFENLKNYDLTSIISKVNNKHFDWTAFDRAINANDNK